MRKPTLFKLVMSIALLSFISGFAQDKPVTQLLKTYIKATNNLEADQNPDNIMMLLDKNYQNNTAYIGLTGALHRTSTTYGQFAEQIAEDIKNHNYNFTMALSKTVYESQKETSGTVSALINFESKIDGKVAEKGTILMNIVATKSQGEWKITQNNTVRVSEESEIGNCVCYLFSKGKSFFNAETYYPAGVKYEREYKSYRVSIKDGKRTIVNRGNNDRTFTWADNGDVLDGGRKIGTAVTPDEAVQAVLTFVYGKTCTKINFS
jgi:hypothetical protein